MPVFIFDVDTPRELAGPFDTDPPHGEPERRQRPCYLIGPFETFPAMHAWVDANEERLSVFWQSVTLPDLSGTLAIYPAEQAAQDLPVLHELPEAKARYERTLAIQQAMRDAVERMEEQEEEYLENNPMPLPKRKN